MSLTINGLDAVSMRFHAPWNGPWSADIEIQGDVVPSSGKAVVVSTEGIALVGTIDPERSGTFGQKHHARVVAGGGGWGNDVRAQHYHSDAGLPLAVLASTTAAECGEVVTVLLPVIVGVDFARCAGPASQIFTDAGVDWWVGLDGVTRVGIRPPQVAAPDVSVLDWDPAAGTMRFMASALVEPGTVLIDDRFGTRVVLEVEATISDGSVTGTLWVGDSAADPGSVSELVDSLAAIAKESTRATFGRLYEYRVIAMSGERVELQAVAMSDGVPDMLPAVVWAGISGYKAKLLPASRCLVGFVAGDSTQPYVAAYEPPDADGWRPIEIELDALLAVKIGGESVTVTLGSEAGAMPLARLTPSFATWIAAVTTALNGLAPGSAIAPLDVASSKVVAS